MHNFKGKNVLVSGGSRGIGRATALEFAKLGANVAITFNTNVRAAKAVERKIKSYGVDTLYRQTNDDPRGLEMDDVLGLMWADWGSVDVAVANAGIWSGANILDMGDEEFRTMMDVNMTNSFLLAKFAAQRMIRRKRGGSIILVSSTAGQRGESGHSHYAASKGAQISFAKSLAVELAPYNIRVNCVAPGWVETDMTAETLRKMGSKIKQQIPLGRVARPEEIAQAIVFLASPAASFITGEVLNVNGGSVLCG